MTMQSLYETNTSSLRSVICRAMLERKLCVKGVTLEQEGDFFF